MELLIIFGRLLSSSLSNVVQKKLTHHEAHPFFIVMMAYLILSLICMPLLPIIPWPSLSPDFWIMIVFAALADMIGTVFLVLSLSTTDLSVFGPLNAYKVVISMLLAFIFIGEVPDIQGLIGITVILLGSIFLLSPRQTQSSPSLSRLFLNRGVQYRFLSILLFSIGTLPLKQAVISGGAIATTVFWCVFGLPFVVMGYVLFLRQNLKQDLSLFKTHSASFILLAGLMLSMQWMTMIIFSHFLIAYALAFFQLGMIIQVLLGHRIFREPHLIRRLVASLIMVSGSLLVFHT